MLTIRLQRVGKKKFPTYRLIINEKGRDTHDRYLELLGTYNPHAKENQFVAKADRINYWLSKGAEASGTVHNLLVKAGIIKSDKVKSVHLSTKRKTKIGEKNKAKAEAEEKAKAEVAAKAEAEKKAAEEAKAAKEAEAKTAAEAKAAEAAAPAPTETPAA